MKRQTMTLDKKRWIDLDNAEMFGEAGRWDGNNNISVATGSQWGHEALYRTPTGRWVLRSWSSWNGADENWREVSRTVAVAWLDSNGHELHEVLGGCSREALHHVREEERRKP